MSKAEDKAAKKALEKFPILFGERMGYDKTNLQQERRNAYEKGYLQAEKDCLLKINHLVNKVDIDNDAYEDLEDLYDSLCELIKHNRIGYIPEKDLELTWEDMRELHIIFAQIDVDIELCKTDIKAETIGYYEEVLKRFNKERKEK